MARLLLPIVIPKTSSAIGPNSAPAVEPLSVASQPLCGRSADQSGKSFSCFSGQPLSGAPGPGQGAAASAKSK